MVANSLPVYEQCVSGQANFAPVRLVMPFALVPTKDHLVRKQEKKLCHKSILSNIYLLDFYINLYSKLQSRTGANYVDSDTLPR
jgi:hypothetical protein